MCNMRYSYELNSGSSCNPIAGQPGDLAQVLGFVDVVAVCVNTQGAEGFHGKCVVPGVKPVSGGLQASTAATTVRECGGW